MPDCEICGAQQVKTYECKECGKQFCVRCGKSHKKICNNCLSDKGKGSGSGKGLLGGFLSGFRMKK
ncbi:hypothetical protein JXL21_13745 [Candidatus Bathyarchaeota archaeon]|nr:hypothetical protein [Candidatus Bathyarchaeota archaeon]